MFNYGVQYKPVICIFYSFSFWMWRFHWVLPSLREGEPSLHQQKQHLWPQEKEKGAFRCFFVNWCIVYYHYSAIADVSREIRSPFSGGFRGCPRLVPPYGPKFSQFHAVFRRIWQNHMLPPPTGELAPPPTGNPGSAPAFVVYRLLVYLSHFHRSSYWPQRSCGQGNVFTHVCDSVNGGVSEAEPPLGQTPQSRHPPGADTPLGTDTPLGADTPQVRPPGVDTPRD